MTIWKFPLQLTDAQTIRMPAGADILTVQLQHDVMCLWAVVEPNKPTEQREILIFGTGHEVRPDIGRYIGTCQQIGGALIWHVFEGSTT